MVRSIEARIRVCVMPPSQFSPQAAKMKVISFRTPMKMMKARELTLML
jgi:hypothetical protein